MENFEKNNIFIKIIKGVGISIIFTLICLTVFSALLTYVGSTDSVAVYSIGWKMVIIGTTPILAIGTALISVIAANYGAKNYDNIRIAHRYAMKISIIFAFAIAILTNVFAGDIASLFTSSGTSVRIASELTSFLQWIVIYYPTMAVGVASTYVFQGVGRGITAMFQTIMRETGFTIFFAVLFGVILGYGVWGAWMGIVLGEIVSNNITMIWANTYITKLININS